MEYCEYDWSAETFASLKAGIEAFGGEIRDYCIQWDCPTHSYVRISVPSLTEWAKGCDGWDRRITLIERQGIDPDSLTMGQEEGIALLVFREELAALGSVNPETNKGLGDCKLTGYCMDESFLGGVRESFAGGETDLKEMLNQGVESLLADACSDYEGQLKEESEGTEGNEGE